MNFVDSVDNSVEKCHAKRIFGRYVKYIYILAYYICVLDSIGEVQKMLNMLKGVKAVVFDLDGTLIDSMWIWEDIDREFLGKRGIELPDDICEITEGMGFTETAEYFKQRFNLKETVEEIKQEWLEMTKDYYKEKIPLKEGVLGFLEFLYSRGIRMAIASSCSRELIEIILGKYDLQKYFSDVVVSCDVKQGKPNPYIFLKAIENLRVSSHEALAFEDTRAGVLAAKRAGLRVCAVYDEASKHNWPEIKQLAGYHIYSFKELLP